MIARSKPPVLRLAALVLAVHALAAALAVGTPGALASEANALAADPAASAASGPLDGMVFEGRIGTLPDPDVDDRLYFEAGKFWSQACIRCGYRPGDYWVRRVGDTIQFTGELVGEGGKFVYRGEIRDGSADVRINWTKRRWYWSIDRDLAFRGALRPGAEPDATAAARLAAGVIAAGRPPGCRY